MEFPMSKVASVILGGGQGTRLFPLTRTRCKPAISFGGRYRLIDVPVSSSINSHIHKIFVVTQFLSTSLHRHLMQAYQFDAFSSGFLELLSAEEKPEGKIWFQGTADAVRQNHTYLEETPVDYFLILSGDQLYNMNFEEIVQFGIEKNADLVIATLPVAEAEAKRMGVMKIDNDSKIVDFIEKPQDNDILQKYKVSPEFFTERNISLKHDQAFLGSMGIYLFKKEVLLNLLKEDTRNDFGKHLIPHQIQKGGVYAYLYNGYWEDIGTIGAFHKANIALTRSKTDLECYNESNLIYTHQKHLPAPKIINGKISDAIICEGSIVDACSIESSILGVRSIVNSGSIIKNSLIMGNDFYIPPTYGNTQDNSKMGIGKNCIIENTIIDENVCIGDNVQLTNANGLTHFNGDNIFVRDGIIVVTRGAKLDNNFVF